MSRMTISCIIAAAAALAQPAFAASDPFVGKWKLDVPRSRIVDEMRVTALASNRYAFNFEGAPTETIVADGTDQPGLPGTTLAVKALDPHHLTVVRKQDGQTIVSAAWTLSGDGRALHDAFTSIGADGSKSTTDYLYRRISGNSGFAGTWESTTPPQGLELELTIEPYRTGGLRFVSPGSDRSVIFDGREHAVPASKGVVLLGRPRSVHGIEYTEKDNGKIVRVRQFKLSIDRRTLTETIRVAGQATPTIFVFDRE